MNFYLFNRRKKCLMHFTYQIRSLSFSLVLICKRTKVSLYLYLDRFSNLLLNKMVTLHQNKLCFLLVWENILIYDHVHLSSLICISCAVSVEKVLRIVYQPQALFRIRPVNRCSATIAGLLLILSSIRYLYYLLMLFSVKVVGRN